MRKSLISKSKFSHNYPIGWDEWLHSCLMIDSPTYNLFWWQGKYTLCLTLQSEFAAILDGSHG